MKKLSWFIIGFITAINVTAFAASGFLDEGEFASWNREAIQNVSEKGIITGYSDGRFGPNDYVTRAQLAVVLDRLQKQQAGILLPPPPPPTMDVSVDDDAMKGNENAPVTIIEFSDYECPFCARFFRDTFPQIVSEYIDTGKVRFVYRDFPLNFHKNARPAALAAECAGDQGGDEMYFAMHDKIFENQALGLTRSNLDKWATEVGASATAFKSCMDSEKFDAEISKDFADGQSYGVTGTPGFFINGKKLSGAQPYSVFKTLIDGELSK